MPLTWVITRAEPDADADAAALRAVGITALVVPCIERVALPWPDWNPPGNKAIVVSSPFAAVQLGEAWPSLLAPRPVIAAMAPFTTAKLKGQGVPVDVEASGGVVALATALREWHAQHPGPLAVLYPTSDAGTRQAEQNEAVNLLGSFARVDRVPVYSTRAPEGLDARLAALPAGVGYVFMSPSAVENVLASFTRRRQTFSAAAVACIGQSTHRRYRELSREQAATHHPSFSAFLAALVREKSP